MPSKSASKNSSSQKPASQKPASQKPSSQKKHILPTSTIAKKPKKDKTTINISVPNFIEQFTKSGPSVDFLFDDNTKDSLRYLDSLHDIIERDLTDKTEGEEEINNKVFDSFKQPQSTGEYLQILYPIEYNKYAKQINSFLKNIVYAINNRAAKEYIKQCNNKQINCSIQTIRIADYITVDYPFSQIKDKIAEYFRWHKQPGLNIGAGHPTILAPYDPTLPNTIEIWKHYGYTIDATGRSVIPPSLQIDFVPLQRPMHTIRASTTKKRSDITQSISVSTLFDASITNLTNSFILVYSRSPEIVKFPINDSGTKMFELESNPTFLIYRIHVHEELFNTFEYYMFVPNKLNIYEINNREILEKIGFCMIRIPTNMSNSCKFLRIITLNMNGFLTNLKTINTYNDELLDMGLKTLYHIAATNRKKPYPPFDEESTDKDVFKIQGFKSGLIGIGNLVKYKIEKDNVNPNLKKDNWKIILDIKRAGDSSQISFVKKQNKEIFLVTQDILCVALSIVEGINVSWNDGGDFYHFLQNKTYSSINKIMPKPHKVGYRAFENFSNNDEDKRNYNVAYRRQQLTGDIFNDKLFTKRFTRQFGNKTIPEHMTLVNNQMNPENGNEMNYELNFANLNSVLKIGEPEDNGKTTRWLFQFNKTQNFRNYMKNIENNEVKKGIIDKLYNNHREYFESPYYTSLIKQIDLYFIGSLVNLTNQNDYVFLNEYERKIKDYTKWYGYIHFLINYKGIPPIREGFTIYKLLETDGFQYIQEQYHQNNLFNKIIDYLKKPEEQFKKPIYTNIDALSNIITEDKDDMKQYVYKTVTFIIEQIVSFLNNEDYYSKYKKLFERNFVNRTNAKPTNVKAFIGIQ